MVEIGKALITMRNMVDSFICVHQYAWDKFQDKYKKEHIGIGCGRDTLSMQSFVGSDLTIDLAYLANDIETRGDFTNEYWIRSQGIQCIRNEKDRENNERVWSDIAGKFKVIRKGDDITFEWMQDDKCRVENQFLKDGKLYERW